MELRDLQDFYEKQVYTEKPEKTELDKRVNELTFFANIASFSILLVIFALIATSILPAVIALPLAFIITLPVFISFKKAIRWTVGKILN